MKMRAVIVLGKPAVKVVAIKPMTPWFEMRMKPRGKPMAAPIMPIMRMKVV